jgi:hypothetical protein
MYMPNDDGYFTCEHDDFKTSNLFAYMEHAGMEFDWLVRLSPKYSLNLFTLLSELTYFMNEEKYDDVWEHIQSVTLLLMNSCTDDFDKFIHEAEVISGTERMFDQIESYLDENK